MSIGSGLDCESGEHRAIGGEMVARPRTLPMGLGVQPRPVTTLTARLKVFRWTVTAVYRAWRPGDAARCRLCRKCAAHDGGCLLVFGRDVADSEAPLVSTWDLTPGDPARPERPFG